MISEGKCRDFWLLQRFFLAVIAYGDGGGTGERCCTLAGGMGATYLVVCNQAVAPGDVDRITATGAKAADEVLPVGQTCKPLFPQEPQPP